CLPIDAPEGSERKRAPVRLKATIDTINKPRKGALMDIWRWVVEYAQTLARDGNLRLAQLLMKLPEATCEDRHTEVDAMVPEALALVRAQKNPWAEVYVRHWHLQSKVLHRHQVAECLPEA